MQWQKRKESRAQLPVFERELISAPDDAPSDEARRPDGYRKQIADWYPPEVFQDLPISQYAKANGEDDCVPHNQRERQ